MAVSNIKAVFSSDVKRVWDVVTDVENYPVWRSDLSKTKVLNEKQFIEYTKDGYETVFTITFAQRFGRWEFDMDNKNMHGHWAGIFFQKDGKTEVEFTEDVNVKKFFLKPFVKSYLKKQQTLFVSDLERALSEQRL